MGWFRKDWICTGGVMSEFFLPMKQSGTIEKTIQYADNEIAEVKLEIFLSHRDWCEIQKKPCYQELIRYLNNIKIR